MPNEFILSYETKYIYGRRHLLLVIVLHLMAAITALHRNFFYECKN